MYREPTNSLNSTKSAFLTFKRYQPISAPDPPTLAPVTTTAKSLNALQPAARARTCRRCEEQFKSGNELHKHLRESCRFTQQQQETRLNTMAISKASPDQTTALNADQITTPESNDSELPIKDIKQLPTPSRTVSPESTTAL